MMRYGVAVLAASYTQQDRTGFSDDITKKIKSFLTNKVDVPDHLASAFREYVYNKPGSPRYTPLRRNIQAGKPVDPEHQDLLFSDTRLSSSVGALTQDYFDDALGLAHTLKLVKRDQNLLLARGRLSLSTGWTIDDPFHLSDRDALYLGLWLLDVDCDWVWAFLCQLPDDSQFEVTTENRVELLLRSWDWLLGRTDAISQSNIVAVRRRIKELRNITERNVREKLNLGQPWSWFLVPRLELLVDAGILSKAKRYGLSGYSLTNVGKKMHAKSLESDSGQALIDHYFACHDEYDRLSVVDISWDAIRERLDFVKEALSTTVGYLPIFESAAAMCVDHFFDQTDRGGSLWEVGSVRASILRESKIPGSNVRLGINRHGNVSVFRVRSKDSASKAQDI